MTENDANMIIKMNGNDGKWKQGTESREQKAGNRKQAALYSRQEVSRLLENETFSSRAQIAAYMFSIGALDVNTDNAAL